MILWTPSKNNQRYAFTPLLDAEGNSLNIASIVLILCQTSLVKTLKIRHILFVILIDDEEDEEDEAYYTDAFDGMKQRMTTLNGKTDKMEKVRCKMEVDSY